MTVLRATEAGFARDGRALVTPFSVSLAARESVRLVQATPFAASLAARMCAAIVKPSSGTIFVGEYETRLQAPQAKRRIGFVDAAGFPGDAHAFACEIAFHAECWGVAPALARGRARDVLRALDPSDGGDPYARAVALALAADVTLVVLDQPPATLAPRLHALVPGAALLVVDAA